MGNVSRKIARVVYLSGQVSDSSMLLDDLQ
jgi:hypothetical protein